MPQSSKSYVPIPLPGDCGTLIIEVDTHKNTSPPPLITIPEEEARRSAEEPYQLLEGASYYYELPCGYSFENPGGSIISPSVRNPKRGRISPGIYTGRLELSLLKDETPTGASVAFEVRSRKADYLS